MTMLKWVEMIFQLLGIILGGIILIIYTPLGWVEKGFKDLALWAINKSLGRGNNKWLILYYIAFFLKSFIHWPNTFIKFILNFLLPKRKPIKGNTII